MAKETKQDEIAKRPFEYFFSKNPTNPGLLVLQHIQDYTKERVVEGNVAWQGMAGSGGS